MKMFIFAVYDCKAEAYMTPFFMQSRGTAVRSFTEVSFRKDNAFSKYPEDFTLFLVGEWEDSHSRFDVYNTPISLGTGLELINVGLSKSHLRQADDLTTNSDGRDI